METFLFWLKSMILGIVEGITEFLPVSSTGHLIIFENLLRFSGDEGYVEMYSYVIQLGAILAVIILFREKIWETIIHLFPTKNNEVTYENSGFRFWLMIVIACIPGTIAEFTVGDAIETYLFNPYSVAGALVLGAVLLIMLEQKYSKKNGKKLNLIVTVKQALIVGCFQCLAVIPGMSRSASTIMGGWVAGLSTVSAAEFSFFLAIPVMFGMSFLKLVSYGGFGAMTGAELGALIVGFVVSLLVALVVVKSFITYLKKKPMKVFAYYRVIFAVVVVIAGIAGLF